ncbi:MAG: hypothetical protein AB4058_04130 [Microcystaceae cyanobacterium]
MESTTNPPLLSPKGTFPATVAEIIDKYKLVINRGKQHNLEKGQRMQVYRLSDDEIKDPETGESLGYLELLIGTGEIIYVQEKMSILESVEVYNPYLGETLYPAFDKPQVGDKVKPI